MTVVALLIMAAGAAFLLVAAIGLIRLRDPLQRMHSATKAGTLGTTLIILGTVALDAVARPSSGLLAILFLIVTLPFGAQLLGRAAYLSKTPMEGITFDPLAEVVASEED